MAAHDNDQSSEQQTESPSVDLVTQIIVAATDAVERYKQQLLLGKALAGREWRLSVRALLLVLAGLLLFVAVISTIWIIINVVLALSLFKLGIHWA
ncbi:MAG: Flp pilus assembly protein TadB, partial [Paraglaciecola sp.]